MNTGIPDDSVKDYYRLLTASKKEKNVKQKLRYDTVLLYLEGYPGKQISEILHIPRRTVSYHISRYENNGMDSLVSGKHPGTPKKLSDAQESELLTVISTKTPQEADVGIFANWTAPPHAHL